MMKYLLFFMLMACCSIVRVQAQEHLDFKTVDSDTYHYFMNQKWDSLVAKGKAGLHNDIDYYYLRVRMGLAYFYKGKYCKAITHLNKALEFNSGDTIAMEYLYYAYDDFNRPLYQNALARKIHPQARKRIFANAPLYKNSFVPEAGSQFDQKLKVTNDQLIGRPRDNFYGEIDYPLYFYFFGLNYKHYFNGLALNISYEYFNSHRENKFVLPQGLPFDHKYTVGEHHFYANTEISLSNKLTIIPAVQFQDIKYSKYTAKINPLQGVYNFPDSNYRYNNFIASVGFYKDIDVFSLGLTLSYSNIYKKSIEQGAFLFSWFPLGNTKLYTTTTIAYLIMPSTSTTIPGGPGRPPITMVDSNADKSHAVFEEAVGGRVTRKLWLEAQFAFNGFRGYNKSDAAIVYNNPDQVKYLLGFTAVYEISKVLELSIGYQFMQKELTSEHLTGNNINRDMVTDNYLNNSHNIYGGIKWKL